jgi:hypothetical protein
VNTGFGVSGAAHVNILMPLPARISAPAMPSRRFMPTVSSFFQPVQQASSSAFRLRTGWPLNFSSTHSIRAGPMPLFTISYSTAARGRSVPGIGVNVWVDRIGSR